MVKDDLIIVKAKIKMKTTEDGGRLSGFKSGYRPNHVFELPDNLKYLRAFGGDINCIRSINIQMLLVSSASKLPKYIFITPNKDL